MLDLVTIFTLIIKFHRLGKVLHINLAAVGDVGVVISLTNIVYPVV